MLHITRWRIADQFRKRKPAQPALVPRDSTGTRTPTIERIADPARFDLENAWDAEWQRNLLDAAIERVKAKVDPKQFQIFDCYVRKEWSAQKVAERLGVNVGQVYLARHRVGALLKREIKALEKAGR